MCGIIFQFGKPNLDFCKGHYQFIEHRGRSNYSEIWGEKYFAAHHLLSITGNSIAQPFNHGGCIFMVNGEFYDYEKNKNYLSGDGYHFKTDSDSELIIPAYKNLFKNLTNGILQGEFAGLIYDTKENKLTLFRDPWGIKPLYYYIKDENIYVASEIKAFLSVGKLKFNMKTVGSVLTFQYHSGHDTLFENVFQVPPGHVVEIKNGKISKKRYFYREFSKNRMSYEENKIILKELIDESVGKRIANRKMATCLSGGIDSSIIFYESRLQPYTFNFGYGNEIYNEGFMAKELSNKYGMENIIVEGDLINNFEKAVYSAEQVSINLHQSAKYLLFKRMSENGVKVSLSGEGSDEIFWGYQHLIDDYGNTNIKNTHLKNFHYSENNELIEFQNQIILKMGYIPAFLNAKFKMAKEIKKYSFLDYNFDNIFKIVGDYDSKISKVEKSSILWSDICLSNYILNGLGDKMEMKFNIEGRVPFLDYDLVKFVDTIPDEFKIGKQDKQILRDVYKPYLTENIINKNKHPFISPPHPNLEFIKQNIDNLSFIDYKNIDYSVLSEQSILLLVSLGILSKNYT